MLNVPSLITCTPGVGSTHAIREDRFDSYHSSLMADSSPGWLGRKRLPWCYAVPLECPSLDVSAHSSYSITRLSNSRNPFLIRITNPWLRNQWRHRRVNLTSIFVGMTLGVRFESGHNVRWHHLSQIKGRLSKPAKNREHFEQLQMLVAL